MVQGNQKPVQWDKILLGTKYYFTYTMRVNNCFSVCLQGKSFLDSPSRLSLPKKEYPKEGLEEEVVDEVQGAINFVSFKRS